MSAGEYLASLGTVAIGAWVSGFGLTALVGLARKGLSVRGGEYE